MENRKIIPGYFVELDSEGEYEHSIGGEQSIEGAWCPNCDMPLMLHMTLDTRDPDIGLNHFDFVQIPLLYCSRCSLSWHSFTYSIISETKIKQIEFFTGQTAWEDWYEHVGFDTIPKRDFVLRPIPERLQELYDKLNDNQDLSQGEEEEVASYTGQYARPEVGGYPVIDVINQVGGRSFLCQRLLDPECVNCSNDGSNQWMYFLASMTNDPKKDLVVSYDSVQIVFFICSECGAVSVRHSI